MCSIMTDEPTHESSQFPLCLCLEGREKKTKGKMDGNRKEEARIEGENWSPIGGCFVPIALSYFMYSFSLPFSFLASPTNVNDLRTHGTGSITGQERQRQVMSVVIDPASKVDH
jgi:hypothetical protein